MINRFFAILIALSALSAVPGAARAQVCRVEYEAHITLRKPEYGSYSLWSAAYGEPGEAEVLRDGIFGEGDDRLSAVGERGGGDSRELLFVQAGLNGRILLQQAHPLQGLEDVVRILPHQRGFAVFANRKDKAGRRAGWMGIFDRRGFLLGQSPVGDDLAGAQITAAAPAPSAGGAYFVAVSAEGAAASPGSGPGGGGATPPSAALLRLGPGGSVLSRNAFVTGGENRILGLDALDDGGVLATGFSHGADGRKNGWIMRLDEKAGIIWQQVYPRGAGAELSAGSPMPGGLFAVAGTATSIPAFPGVKRRAGWVMTVDADGGAVGWQRFFSGAAGTDFYGRDLRVSPDGVISALLGGVAPAGAENRPHVRIAALSGRGELFSAPAFYNGESAAAFRFASGAGADGGRVLTGSTLIVRPPPPREGKDAAQAPEIRDHQGWMLAVPPAAPYKDPCALPHRE